MDETIYISNRINQSDFLKSRALMGESSFNVRLLNVVQFVDLCFSRLGLTNTYRFITSQEQEFIIFEILENSKGIYDVTSFDDVRHIVTSLNSLRKHIDYLDEVDALKKELNRFQNDKNVNALYQILKLYNEYLTANGLIDNVAILRLALTNPKKIFDKVYVWPSDHLTPLEYKAIKCFADNVINASEHLSDKVNISSIKPYYGSINEVRAVVSDIYEHNYNLDECLIVSTNTDIHSDYLYDLKVNQKIPITFGCGYPIRLSKPYQLYLKLFDLETKYQFDVEGYKKLILSDSFNYSKIVNRSYLENLCLLMGNLKICFDKDVNEKKIASLFTKPSLITDYPSLLGLNRCDKADFDNLIACFKDLVNDFSKGFSYVLENYSFIRKDAYQKLDQDALMNISNLCRNAKVFKEPTLYSSYLSIITHIVSSSETRQPGHIHFVDISSAFSIDAKHVYVIGLSSDNFPGNPTEDFLVPDSLYSRFTGIESMSDQIVNNYRDDLMSLLKKATKNNADIHLSYSFFNLSEVKTLNPSSVIFDEIATHPEKYQKDYLKNECDMAVYFKDSISPLNGIVKKYLDKSIAFETGSPNSLDLEQPNDLTQLTYSPSDLEVFKSCEYKFYLSSILKLKDEFKYNRYDPLSSLAFGNIVHKCMELYHNGDLATKDEFIAKGKELVQAYYRYNIPLISTNKVDKEIVDCLSNVFSFINCFKFDSSEETVSLDYNGIHLKGRYDALCSGKNGDKILVDFKTDNKIKRANENFDTCLQVSLYLFILNENGINVSKGIYYYTRFDKEIVVSYTPELRRRVIEFLTDFKTAITTRDFMHNIEYDGCQYCIGFHNDLCKESDQNKNE